MKTLTVTERLAANRFVLDEEQPHIVVHQELAKATGTAARIIAACPAKVYSWAADGSVAVEYAACLECGTCLAIADPGTLEWHYPSGPYGVQFREG
ncbi:MAG: 4Fe-4S dicluster domain-containing protein [Bifidobacteriaceae bacterium]|jgi:ferredoxin like protein|nr:4Fe-4S dicluster domain-containing protein [Bifidobacteriaceae bacterium]